MRKSVDMSKFVHDTWENDWYECPYCGYDSIDFAFHYCPICREILNFGNDEEDKEDEE